MHRTRPAVHRTILVVDVEAFGSSSRTNAHRVAVRAGLYWALRRAFRASGIPWGHCHVEDRGDGALILAPPELPKAPFGEALPAELAIALHQHNAAHHESERIRLRMALHAGEVHYDSYGVAAASVNLAFRLLDAPPLKAALAESPGTLALIASAWFFEEVIRHAAAASPARYRCIQVDVKETTAIAWIALPDHPYPPDEKGLEIRSARSDRTVPRQLPACTAHFAGRAHELQALNGLLEETAADIPGAGRTAGTVVISTIGGMAGIGKTALAVHWAHTVAGQFPDGQLYVDLRGFGPAKQVMDPAEAIRAFLDALEVPPDRIPSGLDAQAALYRSLLAGRRMLVVLDNARDPEQVRPLLPGSSGCIVLVTSRSQLSGLVAANGARPIDLDLLTPGEAHEMLVQRLGPGRVAAEPEAAEGIIARCVRLPLALAIVAARAAAHPHFSLNAFATELGGGHDRLDALTGGEPAADARSVFSWSYGALTTEAASLFRLLGLHPGPDISTLAAASLAGLPPALVRTGLAELTRANLISEQVPGRYTFHDLLRAYAGELARLEEPAEQRDAATHRMLDHYLHTAWSAALLLDPSRDPIALAAPRAGTIPEALADHGQALAWFTTEQAVLLAAVDLAADLRLDTHIWQLAWTLATFQFWRGHWSELAAVQSAAVAASQRLADTHALGMALRTVAQADIQLGRFDDARTHLEHALDLYDQVGGQTAKAAVHINLARIWDLQGRYAEALDHARQSLDQYRAAGHRDGQAVALNTVGWYHALLGDQQQALMHCQQALALFQELGDLQGQADAWDSLGYAHDHLGDHDLALTCYEHALGLFRDLGVLFNQAEVLIHLGDAHHAADNPPAARDAWQQALTILDELGHPGASQVRAKLAALRSAPTSAAD